MSSFDVSKDDDAKKKSNITGPDRVYSNIEQWILTKNMEKLDKVYQAEAAKDDFKYYTFRQLDGPGPQIINRLRGLDDLSVFYRIKTSTLSLLQPKLRIYKVTYEQFDMDGSGQVDQGSVRPLPSPCYREFKFSDNFGMETAASVQEYLNYESTKPTFRNVGLESFMVTQNGETHGAVENNIDCKLTLNFKSLKDLNASPPGQSISPGSTPLRYVDLILWPPARFTKNSERFNPKHYEIKVLMGYTAPPPEQLDALNLSPLEIAAIKDIEKLNQIISLGLYDYNIDIQENGAVKLTANYRGRLETVIGSNQVNIFQDTIRLGESGHVELATTADAKLNISHFYKLSSDINTIHSGLKQPYCIGDCEEKKTLVSMTRSDPIFASVVKDAMDNKTQKHGLRKSGAAYEVVNENKYFEWFKSDINGRTMMALMKKKVGHFKQQIYLSFMDRLIDGRTTESISGPTRIFCATAGKEQLRKALGIVEEISERAASDTEAAGGEGEGELEISQSELQTKINSLTTAVGSGQVDFEFGRMCPDVVDAAKKLTREASEATSVETGHATEAAATEAEDGDSSEENKEPMFSSPAWASGDYSFYYVYLGDIIELACKNARLGALKFDEDIQLNSIYPPEQYVDVSKQDVASSYPLVNSRILLGPLEYIGDDGLVKKINLARMPISFKYFRSWFQTKVIKRRRSQMPLGDFLAALINDLVVPALGVAMPESRKAPNTRASIVSVTLPGKINSSIPASAGCGGEIPVTEELLPVQRVINTESPDFKQNYLALASEPRSSESMIRSSYDYLLLYVTSHKDIIERRGDPAEDIKDGIYHFNIGSDQGLLKKMEFKRVNIPFMAELRSEQAEDQGVDQLDQLKFPYDTDVHLVGTSLFIPGMFYYVNPSLAGLGSVEDAASLAYQMNLGGYHLVGQVSTNVAAGKFITQVIGTQTSQGRR